MHLSGRWCVIVFSSHCVYSTITNSHDSSLRYLSSLPIQNFGQVKKVVKMTIPMTSETLFANVEVCIGLCNSIDFELDSIVIMSSQLTTLFISTRHSLYSQLTKELLKQQPGSSQATYGVLLEYYLRHLVQPLLVTLKESSAEVK